MFEIVLCVTGIVTLIIGVYACYTAKSKNTEVEIYNFEIQKQNNKLEKEQSILKTKISNLQILEKETQERLNYQLEEFDNILEKQQALSKNAFENYCEVLNKDYEDKEKEYDNLLEQMRLSYEKQQIIAIQEWNDIKAELDKIKATRAAVIQAQLQEEKIREKKEFYSLCPKTTEINDIKRLERLKPELNNPRILSMLIWTTFFQKPMTALCNNILGTAAVSGIYKITNQENDMCYIGQAVDIATRWKNHAKCGLGIDTPAGNKLYKAMQEFGIWNFTWELLEECPSNSLDEKEAYYIDLYDSYNYGYNSTKGNGVK